MKFTSFFAAVSLVLASAAALSPASAQGINIKTAPPPAGCSYVSRDVGNNQSYIGVKCINTIGSNGCSCSGIFCRPGAKAKTKISCTPLPH